MSTVIFNVTRQWYDLYRQGIKREEYREIKPHWVRKLLFCKRSLEAAVFDEMLSDLQTLGTEKERHESFQDLCEYFGILPKAFTEVIIRCGYPPKGGFPETPDLYFDFLSIEVGLAKEGIGRELVGDKPVFVIKMRDKI